MIQINTSKERLFELIQNNWSFNEIPYEFLVSILKRAKMISISKYRISLRNKIGAKYSKHGMPSTIYKENGRIKKYW